jgi:hypothetical protein
MNQESLEFNLGLASSKNIDTVDRVAIKVTIFNKSQTNILRAEVAVKDNESNQVATAFFGDIPANSSNTQEVNLPGGVDWAVYKVFPAVGEMMAGFGAAANVAIVNLTITD